MRVTLLALLLFLSLCVVSCGSAGGDGGNSSLVSQSKEQATKGEVTPKLFLNIGQNEGAPTDTIHLGRMREGEIIKSAFEIRNTSEEPLVILSIRVDCGCAKATYDTSPIMAGKSRRIDFTFNSAGRPGVQIKYFDVQFAREELNTRVYLDAEVEPKTN